MSASLTQNDDDLLRCDSCGAEFIDTDAAWGHTCQAADNDAAPLARELVEELEGEEKR